MDETKGPGKQIDDMADAQCAKIRELDELCHRLENHMRSMQAELAAIRRQLPAERKP